MPGLMELLFGTGDRMRQVPTMDASQMQGLQQILSQLGMMNQQGGSYHGAQSYLSGILNNEPGAFEQFEAPYKQNFEQNIIPGIAERFAGLGGGLGGGQSSSGFGQALGGAGAQLQAQLAGLRGQLQNQAAGQALGQYNQLANLGLGTRTFENLYQPGSTGLLGGALQGLGGGLGMGFGLPAGAGFLSSLMSLFGNRGQGR